MDSSKDNKSIQAHAKIQNATDIGFSSTVTSVVAYNVSHLPSNPVVSSVFKKCLHEEIYSALATTSWKGMRLSRNRKRSPAKSNRGDGVVNFEHASKGSSSNKVR